MYKFKTIGPNPSFISQYPRISQNRENSNQYLLKKQSPSKVPINRYKQINNTSLEDSLKQLDQIGATNYSKGNSNSFQKNQTKESSQLLDSLNSGTDYQVGSSFSSRNYRVEGSNIERFNSQITQNSFQKLDRNPIRQESPDKYNLKGDNSSARNLDSTQVNYKKIDLSDRNSMENKGKSMKTESFYETEIPKTISSLNKFDSTNRTTHNNYFSPNQQIMKISPSRNIIDQERAHKYDSNNRITQLNQQMVRLSPNRNTIEQIVAPDYDSFQRTTENKYSSSLNQKMVKISPSRNKIEDNKVITNFDSNNRIKEQKKDPSINLERAETYTDFKINDQGTLHQDSRIKTNKYSSTKQIISYEEQKSTNKDIFSTKMTIQEKKQGSTSFGKLQSEPVLQHEKYPMKKQTPIDIAAEPTNIKNQSAPILESSEPQQQEQVLEQSTTKLSEIRSNSQQFLEEGEKAITYLRESLDKLREKNSELVSENNELKIELGNSKKLNEQFQVQKQYLVSELRRIRANSSTLQNEKIVLINDQSILKNKISSLEGLEKVQQDQIWALTVENKKIIDQLNFERELSADIKKQNIYFKGEINNFTQSFQQIIEEIKVFQQFDLKEKEINNEIKHLKEQISEFRENIQELQYKEKENVQLKKMITEVTRDMEGENEKLKEELNYIKRQNQTEKDLMSSNLLLPQDKYLEMLNAKEQKISILSHENISLKKKNQELKSKIQENSYLQLLAPRLHTNSDYVTKLVKQSHLEIQTLKEINENIHAELLSLKETLEAQICTSRNKSEQIDRLNLLLRHERSSKEMISQNEVGKLQSEKIRLQRRIDQLLETQKSLKSDILDKDRVIMTYVQKQKSQSKAN